ncbi:hypothetical protein Epulo_00015 [Candidatus Vecturithrix granuli]|uniref:Uroporphyrinogen decarboxylase (URO-D) domain-containing protein n=1 Tax=Vecturithrix granuli TaxID=1499967 RepID=A0A081C472_VECG1|nr:hypothetical protein Epulo_00015 [Candidatus Vecturithrix granuli]
MIANITAQSFDYEKFNAILEQQNRFIADWMQSEHVDDVPLWIVPNLDLWTFDTCRRREEFLQRNLELLHTSIEWKSDLVFPHLQPWYGVGIYATAFGAHYIWDENYCPQVRPIFSRTEEIEHIEKPAIETSEPMREVLERIEWYREVTHDQLPICLTDTQSPHDTASLLMETNTFFAECSCCHEKYENFLQAITDIIIEFSEKQMEAIGPRLSLPGHQMLCHPRFQGISVSDDNMVMLSPRTYQATSLPYLQKIAANFGGIAVHSCGNVTHNIPNLLKIEGLEQVEHAACVINKSDPTPTPPENIQAGYGRSGVIAKIRLHKSEACLLKKLLTKDFKCVVQITGVESKAESEAVYREFKEAVSIVLEAQKRSV